MSRYIIEGNTALRGDVFVSGNKNAVLPAMAASLLTDSKVTLTNVPQIRDVKTMCLLLQDLDAKVGGIHSRTLNITAKTLKPKQPDAGLVADLRASILLLGPLLARFGSVSLRHPGGDIIGKRSIDQHLEGFQALGARIKINGIVNTVTAKKLIGSNIYLKEISVTTTENIMMAATLARGDTTIINAASEPHVYCLGKLLIKMGAKIQGLGTRTIKIRGVNRLHGAKHLIRPDYIEVGTWMIAAAATGGEIVIHRANKQDLVPISALLSSMGVVSTPVNCTNHEKQIGGACVRVSRGDLRSCQKVQTNTWPGFPTDLMSPTIVLATQCKGTTLAHDWMYEKRMFFVDRLVKMGANIIIADPHRVVISGPSQLFARRISSPDIRAGMALIIASLVAHGTSEINMIELVDRGYEKLDSRLEDLGANIKRL